MSHTSKLPPDYSHAFRKMSGFRGTPTGIRPGTVSQVTPSTKAGLSSKRSPSTPFPAGGKKPWTGKS